MAAFGHHVTASVLHSCAELKDILTHLSTSIVADELLKQYDEDHDGRIDKQVQHRDAVVNIWVTPIPIPIPFLPNSQPALCAGVCWGETRSSSGSPESGLRL